MNGLLDDPELEGESKVERILRERIDTLEARLKRLEDLTGFFASDKDLEGRGREARVKFDPKGWRGRSFKGKPMRECEPDFLDVYANALSYCAEHPKPGKEQYAKYDELDAARARSWARRIRDGWAPPRSSFDEVPATFGGSTNFPSTDFSGSTFDDAPDPFADSDEGL